MPITGIDLVMYNDDVSASWLKACSLKTVVYVYVFLTTIYATVSSYICDMEVNRYNIPVSPFVCLYFGFICVHGIPRYWVVFFIFGGGQKDYIILVRDSLLIAFNAPRDAKQSLHIFR